jgi:hypothetical protein
LRRFAAPFALQFFPHHHHQQRSDGLSGSPPTDKPTAAKAAVPVPPALPLESSADDTDEAKVGCVVEQGTFLEQLALRLQAHSAAFAAKGPAALELPAFPPAPCAQVDQLRARLEGLWSSAAEAPNHSHQLASSLPASLPCAAAKHPRPAPPAPPMPAGPRALCGGGSHGLAASLPSGGMHRSASTGALAARSCPAAAPPPPPAAAAGLTPLPAAPPLTALHRSASTSALMAAADAAAAAPAGRPPLPPALRGGALRHHRRRESGSDSFSSDSSADAMLVFAQEDAGASADPKRGGGQPGPEVRVAQGSAGRGARGRNRCCAHGRWALFFPAR